MSYHEIKLSLAPLTIFSCYAYDYNTRNKMSTDFPYFLTIHRKTQWCFFRVGIDIVADRRFDKITERIYLIRLDILCIIMDNIEPIRTDEVRLQFNVRYIMYACRKVPIAPNLDNRKCKLSIKLLLLPMCNVFWVMKVC